jgi:glycosyltransferase involved in cell wall biosynthesis
LLASAVVARTVPDFEAADPSPVPIGDRRGLLLVGSYDHEPNVEGLRFFLDRIRPGIERGLLERHPVSVVGSNLAAVLRPGDSVDAAVRMVGWVPDLRPYLHHARVAVVPLLHGAGTKRKVVQSLMHGTPLVTTSIGAEGFDLIDGRHALIADDAEAIGRAIERLLRDDTLAGELASRGLEHIRARQGHEAARDSLLAAVDDVMTVAARPAALSPLSFDRYIARLARETANRASRSRPDSRPFRL